MRCSSYWQWTRVKTKTLKFAEFGDCNLDIPACFDVAKIGEELFSITGERSNFVRDSAQMNTVAQIAANDERFRGFNAEFFAAQDRVRTDDFEHLLFIGRWCLRKPFHGLIADPFGNVQKFEQSLA